MSWLKLWGDAPIEEADLLSTVLDDPAQFIVLNGVSPSTELALAQKTAWISMEGHWTFSLLDCSNAKDATVCSEGQYLSDCLERYILALTVDEENNAALKRRRKLVKQVEETIMRTLRHFNNARLLIVCNNAATLRLLFQNITSRFIDGMSYFSFYDLVP